MVFYEWFYVAVLNVFKKFIVLTMIVDTMSIEAENLELKIKAFVPTNEENSQCMKVIGRLINVIIFSILSELGTCGIFLFFH